MPQWIGKTRFVITNPDLSGCGNLIYIRGLSHGDPFGSSVVNSFAMTSRPNPLRHYVILYFYFAFALGIVYTTTMKIFKLIFDTNVIVSGLYSNKGKSYELLQLIGKKNIDISISVALILEYEDVLMRKLKELGLNKTDVEDFLDYICMISNKRKIYFLWRPFLKDLKDDMVLEVAVESGSKYIITHNLKDFQGVEDFGIKALSPKEFLKIMGKSK